jgi:TadE-like protein
MLVRKQTRARRGFMNSLELVFILPIIIIILVVIVQFSQILAAEARLSAASREGARVAASGGNTHQVRHAVHAALLGRERGQVKIETNAIGSDGDPVNLPPGSDVVVRVSIPTKEVVPSAILLVLVNNRVLIGQSVMRKE